MATRLSVEGFVGHMGHSPRSPEAHARIRAHDVFDRLWRGPGATMTRVQAYQWLRETLALPTDLAHIAEMSVEQCERLVVAVRAKAQLDEINGPTRPRPRFGRKQLRQRRQKWR